MERGVDTEPKMTLAAAVIGSTDSWLEDFGEREARAGAVAREPFGGGFVGVGVSIC